MKLLVALALVGLVGAAPAEEFVAPIELDYHIKIGIPKAARIKAAEEALDFDGGRIVGGTPAALGQYPYAGGLVINLTNGGLSMGAATLLTNNRAVTAAHCWRSITTQASAFTVVLGSTLLFSGGTRITTSDVEMHEDYNMFSGANDVAIIRMSSVTYTNTIRNIAMASGSDLFVGTWAWAAGYGLTSDADTTISTAQFMSHVQVQVITNAECQQTFGVNVRDTTLCTATTGGRGTCIGDSGGPLVANNQLIGITSFGHIAGCERGYPAGFSRVTAFNSWLTSRL